MVSPLILMPESKTTRTEMTMTPEQFRDWRRSLGLKQKEAAEQLGLKKRMIQYYEKGNRDGRPVEIPKSIRLACYALSMGVNDFDGTSASSGPQALAREPLAAPPDQPPRPAETL